MNDENNVCFSSDRYFLRNVFLLVFCLFFPPFIGLFS